MGLRRQQATVFVLTYFSYAVLTYSRKIFSVVKTDVQDELGMSTHALGWIDTAFMLCYSVGQLIIPALFENFHRKDILAVAFLGSSLASLGFAFSQSALPMLILFGLMGLCQSSVYPIMLRCLGPLFHDSVRGRVLGAWLTALPFGSFSSTFLGTTTASALGWRWAFVLPSAFTLIIGILLFGFIPPGSTADDTLTAKITNDETTPLDDPRLAVEPVVRQSSDDSVSTTSSPRPTTPVTSVDPPSSHHTSLSPLAVFFGVKDLAPIAASYFFVKLVRYCMLNWLPFYFERVLGYDKVLARRSSTFFDIGALVGSLFTGYFTDKILNSRPLLGSTLMCPVTAIGIILFALAAGWNYAAVAASVLLIGFGIAGPDSVLGAAASQDICERSHFGIGAISLAAGVVNFSGSLGAMIQGALTTVITSKFSWNFYFGAMVVLLTISALFLLPTLPREAIAKKAKLEKKSETCEVPEDLSRKPTEVSLLREHPRLVDRSGVTYQSTSSTMC